MADEPETSSTEEKPASPTDTEPTAKPAEQPVPKEPAAEPAGEPTPKKADEPAQAKPAKKAEVDLSSIPLDELVKARPDLLQSEAVKRQIQSEKDREISRERRRLQSELQRRSDEEQRKRDDDERRRLLEDEDFEGLGRIEAERLRQDTTLSQASATVSTVIEKTVREHPDFATLGAERIEEVYNKIRSDGGNVVDFTLKLAEERRQQDVNRAMESAKTDIDTKVQVAIDAALSAAGLAKREGQVAEGETPSEEVSAGGASKPSQAEMTYTKASQAYGEGEMSWPEFEPFLTEHEKKKAR